MTARGPADAARAELMLGLQRGLPEVLREQRGVLRSETGPDHPGVWINGRRVEDPLLGKPVVDPARDLDEVRATAHPPATRDDAPQVVARRAACLEQVFCPSEPRTAQQDALGTRRGWFVFWDGVLWIALVVIAWWFAARYVAGVSDFFLDLFHDWRDVRVYLAGALPGASW